MQSLTTFRFVMFLLYADSQDSCYHCERPRDHPGSQNFCHHCQRPHWRSQADQADSPKTQRDIPG
jgi:hypothetical protein